MGIVYHRVRSEKRKVTEVFLWICNILCVILIAWFLVSFAQERVKMDGRSMEPTLQNGDVVLVDQVSYRFFEIQRYDLIAYEDQNHPGQVQIKRAAGLPGETVQIRNGLLLINGKEMEPAVENVVYASGGLAEEGITLGTDEYFLLGDWPDVSEDSRYSTVGNIQKKQIIGKCWLIVEPFSRFSLLK